KEQGCRRRPADDIDDLRPLLIIQQITMFEIRKIERAPVLKKIHLQRLPQQPVFRISRAPGETASRTPSRPTARTVHQLAEIAHGIDIQLPRDDPYPRTPLQHLDLVLQGLDIKKDLRHIQTIRHKPVIDGSGIQVLAAIDKLKSRS